MPPHAFATCGLIRGKESADAPVTAGNAGDHHILDDQGRNGCTVMLRLIRQRRLPYQPTRDSVQGNKVSVIGYHEYLVAKNGNAAIGTQRRV